MEHYVVIRDSAFDYDGKVAILGVTHSLDEAKAIFYDCVRWDRNDAEECEYAVYTDNEEEFDAGEEGYYAKDHIRLYIQKVSK